MSVQVSSRDLPPPFAASGNMVIVLDCGTELTAHTAFMVHASSILAEAIALAAEPPAGQQLRLRVKCVSIVQATLLLQVSTSRECLVSTQCQAARW